MIIKRQGRMPAVFAAGSEDGAAVLLWWLLFDLPEFT
jgi:hypothetical protein